MCLTNLAIVVSLSEWARVRLSIKLTSSSYVDRDTAFRDGLVYVTEDGKANMHVDSKTTLTLQEVQSKTKLRPRYASLSYSRSSSHQLHSVRISSKEQYNHGLFLLDVARAPYGCGELSNLDLANVYSDEDCNVGAWPAYW